MARGYLDGYPANTGGKVVVVGTMTGPASYATTGQVFTDSSARSIDYLNGSISLSGTYTIVAKPQIPGNPQRWFFHWITLATGAEAAAATNLSGETFTFFAVYS